MINSIILTDEFVALHLCSLPDLSATAANCEENTLTFSDVPYPVEILRPLRRGWRPV